MAAFSEYSLSEAQEFTLGRIKTAKEYTEKVIDEVDLIYKLQEVNKAFVPFSGKYQTLYNDIVGPNRMNQLVNSLDNLEYIEEVANESNDPQRVLTFATNIRPILDGFGVFETRNLLDEFAYPARLKRTSTRSLASITQALIKANGDPVKAAAALLR